MIKQTMSQLSRETPFQVICHSPAQVRTTKVQYGTREPRWGNGGDGEELSFVDLARTEEVSQQLCPLFCETLAKEKFDGRLCSRCLAGVGRAK